MELIYAKFKDACGDLLRKIEIEHVANEKNISEVYCIACEISKIEKGKKVIDKAFLCEYYQTIQVVNRESEFVKSSSNFQAIFTKLEYLFGLILLDEVEYDRQAGIPRVI